MPRRSPGGASAGDARAAALHEIGRIGAVADSLAAALIVLFGPLGVAIVGIVIFRPARVRSA
jgi:hypothetical protein